LNDTEEIGAADWQVVDRYMAKRQEDVRMMVFNDLSATCERVFPQKGELKPGMRFALNPGDGLVRVLVQVVESKSDLYFEILSSRHDKIICQPSASVQVSLFAVYQGVKPTGTPKLPKTKAEWDCLEGRGGLKLRLWHLLCQFKKYSDDCHNKSARKK
jgi:hypothetical protein